ncbi:acyltransferase [Thermomonas mangrovi]|uniref:acyltransferase n=1 Tax=Thermomonas mangrovi TaxID=2993316 RepID=UPI002307C497|nr:acyltransferase [Thermomonas mangrovi]
MELVFNHRMFRHINESAIKERGKASCAMLLAERLLQNPAVALPLSVVEHVVGFVLALPVPIYSGVIYAIVTSARGLPHFSGMYLRALYYRRKLGRMEPNVFIDQGVFFAYPQNIELKEFSYIDKNVIIMSRTAKVGRRVHIAPRVFVSGGGDFEIEDYACIATNSNIITSTEVLKDGARCSGPMVSADQRNVLRGKVFIRKDAFIGANATLLPGVTVKPGSVVGAGVTVTKDTAPWGIYVGAKTQQLGERQPVKWPDN